MRLSARQMMCPTLLAFGLLASGLLTSLAGCAGMSAPRPFQAMNATAQLDYGYRETKVDPSHYTVVYAGDSANAAETYMLQRAAQVARDAGYTYFAFDKRGVQVLRRSDNDLIAPERVKGPRDMGASNVNDYVPDVRRVSLTTYYYAWGQMALLSPVQAQTNPAALQVNAVLGQRNATP